MWLTVGQLHEEVNVQVIVFKALSWDWVEKGMRNIDILMIKSVFNNGHSSPTHLSLRSSGNAEYLEEARGKTPTKKKHCSPNKTRNLNDESFGNYNVHFPSYHFKVLSNKAIQVLLMPYVQLQREKSSNVSTIIFLRYQEKIVTKMNSHLCTCSAPCPCPRLS